MTNRQTDREAMTVGMNEWFQHHFPGSGAINSTLEDLRDRLLSMGFHRAGSGVSREEILSAVSHHLGFTGIENMFWEGSFNVDLLVNRVFKLVSDRSLPTPSHGVDLTVLDVRTLEDWDCDWTEPMVKLSDVVALIEGHK
jgi:hypothetical protein